MQFPAALLIVIAAGAGSLGTLAWHIQATRALRRIMETDPLTDVGNRRAWNGLCESPPAAGQVAVMLLDLDRFKPINDRYSHAVGDRVLAEFARRLAAAVGVGWVYRLGGDEFAVVLHLGRPAPPDAARQAVAWADGVRSRVVGPWPLPDDALPPGDGPPQPRQAITISSSVGVTCGDPGRLPALLAAADRAMYHAKQTGTGVAYTPPIATTQSDHRPVVRHRDRSRARPGPARHRAAS